MVVCASGVLNEEEGLPNWTRSVADEPVSKGDEKWNSGLLAGILLDDRE